MDLGMTNIMMRSLRIRPELPGNCDPFLGWTATVREGCLYCIHDQSGIGFVFSGPLQNPGQAVVTGIRACLTGMQVLPEWIDRYMSDLGTVRYCKTRDKKQARRVGRFCACRERCIRISETIQIRSPQDRTGGRASKNAVAKLFAEEMQRRYKTRKVYYGTHEAAKYAARPLPSTRIYAGYQFYGKFTYEGQNADACFRYAALTVLDWLRERMGSGVVPPALQVGPAAQFTEMESDVLLSFSGEDYHVFSAPEKGFWSLRVREPDPKVNSRSFITNVGIHILDDNSAELGVRIDILDRNPTLPEAENAFRPKFIRLLFMTPGLRFYQSTPLLYKEYTLLNSKKSLNTFFDLVSDPADQLPLVVFTYARESIVPKNLPNPDILSSMPTRFRAMGQPTVQKAELPFFNWDHIGNGKRPPEMNLPKKKTPDKHGSAVSQSKPAPEVRSYLPYDAAEFASHTYGFAKVLVIVPELFEDLRRKPMFSEVKPGDILLIAPKGFGNAVRTYDFNPGRSKRAYASITESILTELRSYSKHKPYKFGGVMFAEDAQSLILQAETERIHRQIAASASEQEKDLFRQLEQQEENGRAMAQQIKELRIQLEDEYRRGAESMEAKNQELERKLVESNALKIDLEEKVKQINSGYAESKGIRESLDALRQTEHLPQSCGEIAVYFRRIFSDRMDFTDQGLRSAEKCSIKPAVLWDILYLMATALCDLHRKNVTDIEGNFKVQTGLEVAMSEGSQTRSNPKLMALRRDCYDGREISIEPHVKLAKSAKVTGASYQRVYYCYDDMTRRILIGWVGDHLENHSSLDFH